MQKDRSVYVSFVLKSCKKFGDVRGNNVSLLKIGGISAIGASFIAFDLHNLCIVKKTLNV